MGNLRRHKIKEIINYLENNDSQTDLNKNAISENIQFFKNSYSLFSFYKWLFFDASKIKSENLIELMDLDSDSSYAMELISSLAKTERKIFPGIITPLVRKIFHLISSEKFQLILNLGSGAMEVERQIINKLIFSKNKKPVVFIGVDKSNNAHTFAKQNLNKIINQIDIVNIENLDENRLKEIMENKKKLYTIVLCNNDLFSFEKDFNNTRFDLVFNSFFKHHFDKNTSDKIDNLLEKVSKKVIEYDGFNNYFNSFVQSIFVWNNPVLFSGTVFSNLRYKKKSEIKRKNDNSKIKTFWRRGTYLKEIQYQ
jgi:hypothetical protein